MPEFSSNYIPSASQNQQRISSDEDTNIDKIPSRRRGSLALEKAEKGTKEVEQSEGRDDFKMVPKKKRNRIWLRTSALLLTLICLILFFRDFLESEESVVPENNIKPALESAITTEQIIEETSIATKVPEKSETENTPPKFKSKHCTVPHPGRPLIQYALMLDAGSTGSRIHVYRFNYCKDSPELEDEIFSHTKPGLSAYPDDPISAAKSLDVLLKVALEKVPEELYNCTPVAVKATAGLRLLGITKSKSILEAVQEHLETNYPFPIIENDGVVIMDGKDEGVYAWITVNYLLGRIGTSKKLSTAAIFDLGGGSTQIVFEPEMMDGTEVSPGEHRYELLFGGHKYVLYQHSYLYYGLMEARKAIKKFVADLWRLASSDEKQSEDHVPHPCLPKNFSEPLDPNDDTIKLIGTGAGHAQCRFIAEQVLNKEKTCPISPCAFNGIYQPPLRDTFSENEIYAFSYFYDRVSPLGMPNEFSLKELRDLTDSVCSGDIDQFSHLPEALKEIRKNPHYCMDLTFIYGLLHVGYEIPLEREVKIAKKIKGIETGWCLGATIAILDQKLWCK
ncbi:10046_t:CDS:2 [Acaulospora morrowiae]|uniref:guanosine-diphosphatase n=1 Tax=Acaulospora morrowiae TaxID=94023 RepID=A0A9N8W2E9_9GLOM|nr:10046_t:CDS:2 [Acaulospora morrowiae]